MEAPMRPAFAEGPDTPAREADPSTRAPLAREVSEDEGGTPPPALGRWEKRLRATFEQAAVGMGHMDLEGRWLSVNLRLCEVVQCPREELLELAFEDIIHPDDRETDREQRARLVAGEVESYSIEKRYLRRDGSIAWMNLTVSCAREEDGSAESFVLVIEDIDPRKRAEESLAFIMKGGHRLSMTLDLDAVLDALVRLALPRFGDHLVIDLLNDDGAIGEFRTAHSSPEKAPLAHEYRRRYPPEPGDPESPLWRALDSGKPVITQNPHDSWVDSVTKDAGQARLLRAIRPRSSLVVPLRAPGRTVGVISFHSETDRHFGDAEVKLASEVAARAAVALEHARMHGRLQEHFEATERALARAEEARGWTERLQLLTSDFVEALDHREVASIVNGKAKEAIGAVAGGVFLLTPDGSELELVQVRCSAREELASRWRRFAVTKGNPLVESIESRSLLVVESPEDCRKRYPAVAPLLESAGYAAFVVMPMEIEGRVIGVLNYNFSAAHPFTDEERGFITTLGHQAAQAVHRATLLAAEADARRDAEDASRAKSDFLQMMSQELRSPLSTISGYTATLSMGIHGEITEAQRKALLRIEQSQQQLLSIVGGILDFQNLDDGKELTFDLEDLALRDVFAEIDTLMEPVAHAAGVELTIGVERRGLRVRADRDKLRQILVNLLANAVKYTPEGGRVRVDCFEVSEEVYIRVHDSGIGIPADKLEKIFEPFVRLEGEAPRQEGGAGLGLAIARRFAKGMNGDISVMSERGQGSVFNVRLPRALRGEVARTRAFGESAAGAAGPPRPSGSGGESTTSEFWSRAAPFRDMERRN